MTVSQREGPPQAEKMSTPGAHRSMQGPELDHLYMSSASPAGRGGEKREGWGSECVSERQAGVFE